MTITGLAWAFGAEQVLLVAARASLGRGAGGGSLARKLARSVGTRSMLRRAAAEPGRRAMAARSIAHRPLGIDDDARLAGREQAVAIGLDQAAPLLARALGQRKLTSGMSTMSR